MAAPGRFDDLTDAQIQILWDRYYPRLKASIADRVRRMRRPVADESGIALSAFHSLLRRAKAGQFPELGDEESFWRLLRTIAIRKTNDLHKHLWAQKRGGSRGADNQGPVSAAGRSESNIELAVAGRSDSIDELEISEVFNTLLAQLPSERHRDVVLLRLQGADTETIATCLSTTTRTVQRLLKSIHANWEAALR